MSSAHEYPCSLSPEHFLHRLGGEAEARYLGLLQQIEEDGLPFCLGGALALGSYTGLFRDTHDLDLYVLPGDADRFRELLRVRGWKDYFERAPYDRSWIHRAFQGDTIVDIIFGTANHSDMVTESWIDCGVSFPFRGRTLRILAPEEIIRAKIFVLQRGRCDWPDLLNLLYCTCEFLDWERIVFRVGGDTGLLASLITLFAWISPGKAARIDRNVYERLGLRVPSDGPNYSADRIFKLDSRPWFVARIIEGNGR